MVVPLIATLVASVPTIREVEIYVAVRICHLWSRDGFC